MYTFTSTHDVRFFHSTLETAAPVPVAHAASRRYRHDHEPLYARFSDAYRGIGLGPEYEPGDDDEETTDDWLCALMYWSGYQALPAHPVFFADFDTVYDVYNLLHDRPVAWMFAMSGYQRPRGNPPHGAIFPVLTPGSLGGVNAYAVAQINMVFALHAMQSPGVWHGKLCDALGIPRIGRKTMTFKGNVMQGELVPNRLSDGEVVLRPTTPRRVRR